MITDKQVEAAALVVFTATVGRAEEYLKAKGQKQRKDFDRLIRRALEAAEAVADQPIATAPRDGSEILAWHGEWNRMVWFTCDYWSGWIYADGLLTDADPEPPQPTRWRHVPAPPKEPE